MPDQPELRQRLAEAIFQHSVCDCGEYADDFNEQCMHVAARLLSLPGIAIVEVEPLLDIAVDVREDIRQARADGDDERAAYLSGELHGILQCYDMLAAAAGVAEKQTNA